MELNERQERLYEFLIASHNFDDRYISKEYICQILDFDYPRYEEHSTEHGSAAFAMLRKDVRAINFSDKEKIIISSKKGYKIANEEEARHYLERMKKSKLTGLKLYWNLVKKANQNGQIDIDLNEIKTFTGAGNGNTTINS